MIEIIYNFSGRSISDISAAINSVLSNPIWKTHSSYNLGVAITAIAIVVAFIEFISSKRELRFSLNYRKRRIALWIAIASIVFAFFGELDGLFLGYHWCPLNVYCDSDIFACNSQSTKTT